MIYLGDKSNNTRVKWRKCMHARWGARTSSEFAADMCARGKGVVHAKHVFPILPEETPS